VNEPRKPCDSRHQAAAGAFCADFERLKAERLAREAKTQSKLTTSVPSRAVRPNRPRPETKRPPEGGLLIAKDNTILVERYQYGRTDTDRLTSFSMAKSVLALLIGIAVKEGLFSCRPRSTLASPAPPSCLRYGTR
jgi:CubicO group peptidase (beta-lactamase class C family)